jgi:protein O-GlcNAc transferase
MKNSLFIFSLKAIRAKVWCARTESPLFNVKTYTTNLERLFYKMWEKFCKEETPDHIINWW